MNEKLYTFLVDQAPFRAAVEADPSRDMTRLGKSMAFAILTTSLDPVDKVVLDQYGIKFAPHEQNSFQWDRHIEALNYIEQLESRVRVLTAALHRAEAAIHNQKANLESTVAKLGEAEQDAYKARDVK